ncbi:hypothetical protein DFP74_1050 [Nocardiopsis sp. Huas11]|uniref:hypothetical protein n=1 Tax=Nocardiopsis sp. Huas11 TaxID=2183912 RepID=UPI000EB5C073|nr:hypothetical protein [Nocardiopsis sp. Huas11]RKS05451.1 hypothetical protein DFP74_1050 [Nocardiopsis sp. Huas11]
MELPLADGSTVRVTTDMARAMREAVFVPGYHGLVRLRRHTPHQVYRDLVEQGLVTMDPRIRVAVLTARGVGVRELLASAPAAALGGGDEESTDAGAPTRITVDPEVGAEHAGRLHDAVRRGHHRDPPPPPPWRPQPRPRDRARARTVGTWLVGGGLLGSLGILAMSFLLGSMGLVMFGFVMMVLLGVGGAAAMMGSLMSLDDTRALPTAHDGHRAGYALAQDLGDRFVDPDLLDAPARALLGRAQRAVDSVLASSLHDQGLLLDTVRNRVVLADVEWSIAERLREHTRTRRTIEGIATPGEHSRRAAERAREVLDEDVARVTDRVHVLEDYAGKVSTAELSAYDRRAAARLDALTLEAGADHRQHDEALTSLVEAQQLALRVAELSEDALEGGS